MPENNSLRCVDTMPREVFASGAKNGDGANARAETIETYRFTSSGGVVSDFALFIFLGAPATEKLHG